MKWVKKWISFLFARQSIYEYGRVANTEEDMPDERDYSMVLTDEALPDFYELDPLPIRNQGKVGSCASHAAIGCLEYQLGSHQYLEGSELYHYYFAREDLGTLDGHGGMSMRHACKTLKNSGFGFEHLWPYDLSKVDEHPDTISQMFAFIHKVQKYERLHDLDDIKYSLAREGIPVMIGIRVNNDFYTLDYHNNVYEGSNTGGGHAVLIVGYDDNEQLFKIRNSWGRHWGKSGYFWMPYESVLNKSFDWWRVVKK